MSVCSCVRSYACVSSNISCHHRYANLHIKMVYWKRRLNHQTAISNRYIDWDETYRWQFFNKNGNICHLCHWVMCEYNMCALLKKKTIKKILSFSHSNFAWEIGGFCMEKVIFIQNCCFRNVRIWNWCYFMSIRTLIWIALNPNTNDWGCASVCVWWINRFYMAENP